MAKKFNFFREALAVRNDWKVDSCKELIAFIALCHVHAILSDVL